MIALWCPCFFLVKAELKAVLLDELVNRGIFSLPVSGDAHSVVGAAASSVESTPGSEVDVWLKVCLAHFQLEKEEREREFQFHREIELKRLEADTAIRPRQVELQARSTQAAEAQPASCPSVAFDVSKHISLVPVFREAEVETYFGAFERIAAVLHWPDDVWAILLQRKLTGRAQDSCPCLSVEDGLNYDKVKSAILQAYELVPEAYRQRF